MALSDLSKNIPPSPIRKLVPYAQAAKKRGIKIFHLNIGDPDIKTPDVMMEVLKKWSTNPIRYADSKGDAVLLSSLKEYYRRLGFSTITQDDIQVTLGGSEGLLWTFLTLCNPGDEIITFEPFYANYASLTMIARARLVTIPTDLQHNFKLPTEEEIISRITSSTKAILICNPSNPTGIVCSKDELDMLVAIAKKYDLFIIADEVYREFVYDNAEAISILSYLGELSDKVILVDSLSKRYSLCGARLGCVVSKNSEVIAAMLKFAQARLSAGLIEQHMAAELLNVPTSYMEDVIKEYDERRNILINGLSSIEGVMCSQSKGAFYLMVELPVANSEDFSKWLLTDFHDNGETVMVAPASGFYSDPKKGERQVRMAYVLNKDDLNRSVELLSKALFQYKEKVTYLDSPQGDMS